MYKRAPHNKLTQEKVIQQFKEVHGDAFDYSKVKYVDVQTPVEVYCKKHDFTFYPTPKNHKKGSKCKHCGRENQIEKAKKDIGKFIEDSIKIYGDLYDYSLVEYMNNKTSVKLKCDVCGVFEVRPDLHLNGASCSCNRLKTKSTDKDLFLEAAFKVHGDKYDYSNTIIKSSKNKINISCKEHGNFTLHIFSHLSGQKCPKCAMINYNKIRAKSTEQFIKQAKEVHGDNCDYTDTIYQSVKKKVTIKCNKHNEYFTTLPVNHLAGGSCRTCLSENISKANKGKEGTCGYTRSGYVKQANGREACVYLIRCYDDNEEFYKIGKTFLNINSRFTKSNLCYNFEEVHFYYGEAGYIYDLENKLHKKYKPYKYKPNKWFAGYTECFNLDLPVKEIIEL